MRPGCCKAVHSHFLEGYPPRKVSHSIRKTLCSQERWQIITVLYNSTSQSLCMLVNQFKTNYASIAVHWEKHSIVPLLFLFPLSCLLSSIVPASLCFCLACLSLLGTKQKQELLQCVKDSLTRWAYTHAEHTVFACELSEQCCRDLCPFWHSSQQLWSSLNWKVTSVHPLRVIRPFTMLITISYLPLFSKSL